MGAWTPKYSTKQRAAIEHAYCDLVIRPATRIGEMARGGTLKLDGNLLPAFEIPDASIRDIGKRAEQRRAGLVASDLAAAPPADAIEALRRRLLNMLDAETKRLERQQKAKPTAEIPLDRVRELLRAMRELAALPPGGERGRKPGAAVPGQRYKPDSPTKDGLAGQLLASVQGTNAPTALATSVQRPGATQPDRLNTPDNTAQDTPNPQQHTTPTPATQTTTTTNPTTNTPHNHNTQDPGCADDGRISDIRALRVDGV